MAVVTRQGSNHIFYHDGPMPSSVQVADRRGRGLVGGATPFVGVNERAGRRLVRSRPSAMVSTRAVVVARPARGTAQSLPRSATVSVRRVRAASVLPKTAPTGDRPFHDLAAGREAKHLAKGLWWRTLYHDHDWEFPGTKDGLTDAELVDLLEKFRQQEEEILYRAVRGLFAAAGDSLGREVLPMVKDGKFSMARWTVLVMLEGLERQVVDVAAPVIKRAVHAGAALELGLVAKEAKWAVWGRKASRVDRRPIIRPADVALPQQVANEVANLAADIMRHPYWSDIAVNYRKSLMDHITAAERAGVKPSTIAQTLAQLLIPSGQNARADAIALTESALALNAGQQAGRNELDRLGILRGKQWLSMLDAKTRSTHAAAHGQIQPAKSYYEVGGFFCRYPADGSLPAHERCNCRCKSLSLLLSDAQVHRIEQAQAMSLFGF